MDTNQDKFFTERHITEFNYSANPAFGEGMLSLTSFKLDETNYDEELDEYGETDNKTEVFIFDADKAHSMIEQLSWVIDKASDFSRNKPLVNNPIKLGPISRFFHFIGL